MLSSMTAFARQETREDWGSAVWELRSLNHRYLDVSVRLPDALNALETTLRERIKARLQRGKIEVFLRYESAVGKTSELVLNKNLMAELLKVRDEMITMPGIKKEELAAMEVMRWPGVLQMQEKKIANVDQAIMDLFEKTLDDLVSTRQREGRATQLFLKQRLADLQKQISAVKVYLPKIIHEQKRVLSERLGTIEAKLDPARLEQEMVLFTMKTDVAEELNRLETHIAETYKTLDQTGSIGRRLDFLLQELGREANTLGSKSVNTETTLASVEMKVLIEQMREQVQNIE